MRHSADRLYMPSPGTLPAQVVNFFMAAPDERLRTRGPACPPRKDQGSANVLRGRAIMTTDTEALRAGAKEPRDG